MPERLSPDLHIFQQNSTIPVMVLLYGFTGLEVRWAPQEHKIQGLSYTFPGQVIPLTIIIIIIIALKGAV